MAFWDWGARNTAATAVAAAEPERAFQLVEVYTADAIVVGLVEPIGRRLSDILNSNSLLYATRSSRA